MGKAAAHRRHDERERPAPPPFWRRRVSLLATGALALSILLAALSGPSIAIVVYRLLIDVPLLLLWLAAAAGYGSVIPIRRDDDTAGGLGLVTDIALGLGVVSLLQLGLGVVGLIGAVPAYAALGVGLILLAARWRTRHGDALRRWLDTPAAGAEWFWLLVLPALAMTVIAAYVPPGVLWGDEPHGYDVLEYHLQLPREWYELGRVATLSHNVFSHFPLAVEMHYLLAMQLEGGPWNGMYLAQLMHVTFVGLSVLAVYGVARQFAPRIPATMAAIAAAHVPWMMLLAPVAYNEGGLLLFGTLAVGWALRAIVPGGSEIDDCGLNRSAHGTQDKLVKEQSSIVNPRHSEVAQIVSAPFGMTGEATSRGRWDPLSPWLLAGLLAGFACGVKLTAVPLVLLLVPLVAAVVAITRQQPARQVLAGAAVYVLAGLLVFSPWLIRNLISTGNPVFPEAQSLLGRGHFSETQSRRWQLAHSPTKSHRPAAARFTAAWKQIATDWRYGGITLPSDAGDRRLPGLLLVLGVACAAVNWKRPEAKVVLALLLAWLAFWLAFTHLQGRFYVLAIPVAAISVALLRRRVQLYVAGALVLAQVVFGLVVMREQFAERVAEVRDNQILGFDNFRLLLPPDVQQLLDQPDTKIVLAGDAKAFLYQIPMSRLRYRTVFDVNREPGDSAVTAWIKGADPASYVVVDPPELKRFSQTYYGLPRVSDLIAQRRMSTFILPPTLPPAAPEFTTPPAPTTAPAPTPD